MFADSRDFPVEFSVVRKTVRKAVRKTLVRKERPQGYGSGTEYPPPLDKINLPD